MNVLQDTLRNKYWKKSRGFYFLIKNKNSKTFMNMAVSTSKYGAQMKAFQKNLCILLDY